MLDNNRHSKNNSHSHIFQGLLWSTIDFLVSLSSLPSSSVNKISTFKKWNFKNVFLCSLMFLFLVSLMFIFFFSLLLCFLKSYIHYATIHIHLPLNHVPCFSSLFYQRSPMASYQFSYCPMCLKLLPYWKT